MSADQWWDRAACAAAPDLPWLAEAGEVSASEAWSMRARCLMCPVFVPCTRYVSDAAVVAGFWAGRDRSPAYVPPVVWEPLTTGAGGVVGEQAVVNVMELGKYRWGLG